MGDARNPTRRPTATPLAMRSLTATASTALGTVFSFDQALSNLGLQVTCTSGSTGKPCSVVLQGAISTGAGFMNLTGGVWSSTAGYTSGEILFVTGMPVLHVRANLTALSSSAGPVSAWISAC